MVEGALTALKIENSASHTEIKWNSNDELFIIETGARMGGDYITSDLVRLSTGYDFVEGAIIKHHEKWPEIVEWEISDEPLMEVKSNADRRGYFLYQKNSGPIEL